MTYSAILFGAIGTLAETSELQRRAYNMAFAAFDLEWVWEAEIYYRMLRTPGGQDRVATYARHAGDSVDAAAIHRAKEAMFEHLIRTGGLIPRDGVTDLIAAARQQGAAVGFCTTTSAKQVDAVLTGLSPAVAHEDFDWIADRSKVAHGKPDPEVYLRALDALDCGPADALVIEDTPESAYAARTAGLDVVAVPGRAARGRSFPEGVRVLDRLDVDLLRGRMDLAAE